MRMNQFYQSLHGKKLRSRQDESNTAVTTLVSKKISSENFSFTCVRGHSAKLRPTTNQQPERRPATTKARDYSQSYKIFVPK